MRVAINTLVTRGKKIGVGEYLRNLIAHLEHIDRENDYYIFTAKDTRHLFPLHAENFHEVPVNVPQNIRIFSTAATIVWLHTSFLARCRTLDVDVIHIPNTQLMLWRNPATVVTLFDLAEWRMRHHHVIRASYRKLANYMQARLSRSIVTLSHFSRNDICRFLKVPADKVTVTPAAAADLFHRPIDAAEAKALVRKTYGADGEYILSVASHMKHKNIEGILRALGHIKRRRTPSWKLVLVGKADNARRGVRKAVTDLALEKDVIFTGYVPDEHLPYLYAAAKMLVFPSLWEGFGIPVIEAMACGCPVICSNVASLPEVAGDATLFVDPHNIAEIARAITKIEDDSELEKRLRKAGPIQARKFSYRRMAEKTLDVYKRTYVSWRKL